jgi:hypothetical protein
MCCHCLSATRKNCFDILDWIFLFLFDGLNTRWLAADNRYAQNGNREGIPEPRFYFAGSGSKRVIFECTKYSDCVVSALVDILWRTFGVCRSLRVAFALGGGSSSDDE